MCFLSPTADPSQTMTNTYNAPNTMTGAAPGGMPPPPPPNPQTGQPQPTQPAPPPPPHPVEVAAGLTRDHANRFGKASKKSLDATKEVSDAVRKRAGKNLKKTGRVLTGTTKAAGKAYKKHVGDPARKGLQRAGKAIKKHAPVATLGALAIKKK